MTGASLGNVTHVMRHYGHPSQTFVADVVRDVDRLGWTSTVVAADVANREWFPYPPDERVAMPRQPDLARRLLWRARRMSSLDRAAAVYTPAVMASGPDVIHAHFGWALPFAAPAAARSGVPIVVTFHASDVTVWPYQDERNLQAYANAWRFVTVAMAVSDFTAGKLREAGWSGPVEIVPAGVSLSELPFRPPRPRGPLRLIFIGRLVERKGLDVLLDAISRLGHGYEVGLTVVGDGPGRADYVALSERLGLADRLNWLGALSKEGVKSALSDADLFVMPSRTLTDGEAEGSPVALKEALATGLPVVATDSGGTVEVLPPEFRHEIVPQDDALALADRIRAVIDDQPNWHQRAARGREWVEREFDSARVAQRISDLYEAARTRTDGA